MPSSNASSKATYSDSSDSELRSKKFRSDKKGDRDEKKREKREEQDDSERDRKSDRKSRSSDDARKDHRAERPRKDYYADRDRKSGGSGRRDYDDSYRGDSKRSSRDSDRDRSKNYERDRSTHKSSPRRRRHSNSDEEDQKRPSWENSTVRRHAEKIQQKKLLWGKGKSEDACQGADAQLDAISSTTTTLGPQQQPCVAKPTLENTWTSMFAATNADSQKMDKFQRLMGMKKAEGLVKDVQSAPTTNPPQLSLNAKELENEKRRQQELTEQLDRQYALARATTHRGRGRGLGFM